MINYLCFHLIIGKNSAAEKNNYRLLILSFFYITFCIGLNLLSFRREPQGGKNLIPAKKMIFFPSAFCSQLFLQRCIQIYKGKNRSKK